METLVTVKAPLRTILLPVLMIVWLLSKEYSITTASYLSPRANHIGLQSISVAIPAHTAIGNIPSLLEVLMTNHGRRVLTLTIGFRSPYSRCSR